MSTDDLAARKAESDARIARWADRLAAASLTPAQVDGWACVACGRDHADTGRGAVPIGFGPNGQVFACMACDEQFVGELAAQVAPAAVERLRRDIRTLGYRAEDLADPDMSVAAATMLTAYAPGVNDGARARGEQLLSVVGDQ